MKKLNKKERFFKLLKKLTIEKRKKYDIINEKLKKAKLLKIFLKWKNYFNDRKNNKTLIDNLKLFYENHLIEIFFYSFKKYTKDNCKIRIFKEKKNKNRKKKVFFSLKKLRNLYSQNNNYELLIIKTYNKNLLRKSLKKLKIFIENQKKYFLKKKYFQNLINYKNKSLVIY